MARYPVTIEAHFISSRSVLRCARGLVAFVSICTGPWVWAVDSTWTFNGDGNWNTGVNWSAGEPNNSTFNVFIDDGDSAVTVTLNVNRTIGNLSVGADDTLRLSDTFDLSISGSSIVNNGLISVIGGDVLNFNTDIILTNPVSTLSGNGTLQLGGTFQSRILNSTISNELVNSSTHTIAGGGQLGVNSMKITNQGLIDANINGATLFLDPSSSNAVNTATMQASNGGILRLQGGVYTNTGGLIQALDGSEVNLFGGSGAAGTTIVGGTLASTGTGLFRTVGGDGGVVLDNVTLAAGSHFQFGTNLDATVSGTFTNNGTVDQITGTSGTTQILISGDVLLTGSGSWNMDNHANNYFRGTANGFTLTNGTLHTIQGAGDIGNFSSNLVNDGTIIANQSTPLALSTPVSGSVVNHGTLRATAGASMNINLNVLSSADNQGTIEALNGSSVTYGFSAGVANNMAGVLTGGTWRSVSTGGGATITLRGNNITQIAANTEVVLDGVGSVLQVAATPIDSTLTTNNGTLRIRGNRNYTAVPGGALINNGTLELGGGTFNSPVLTNSVSGQIYGFGSITPRPTNSGTIRAVGGTLAFANGIQGGSGTVQIDAGASLDLSAGTQNSSADNLIHNGSGLVLGAHDFLVGVDYQNANFGVGNAFNPRANVTGSGQIKASPAISQSLGGSVTNGGAATATLAFGNVHVGDSPTRNYQINNAGAAGPSLRGAIQTSVGGANLTDGRLSGAGATASNFGPIAPLGNSGNLGVTFNATTAGALTSQQVRIVNNFDDVADQMLQITGVAYRLANPSAHAPEPVNFGIIHVGDVVTQALSLTNSVPNDGFSERLDASIGSPTGSATTNGGSFTALLPGATNNSNLVVGVNTATAGTKTGTATISLVSNGAGTSGLANTNLTSQTVNIQAQVNNFAAASPMKVSGDGTFTMTGTDEFTLNLGAREQNAIDFSTQLGIKNSAAAPADNLAGMFDLSAPGFSLSGFGAFSGTAAGSTHTGLTVILDTAAAGEFAGQIVLHPRSTNLQPFSSDLPDITINLTARIWLAGDYNQDDAVDAADYVVWRNTDGTPAGYNKWRANFGAVVGTGAALTAGPSSAVPEPTLVLLAYLGWAIGSLQHGRRCRPA